MAWRLMGGMALWQSQEECIVQKVTLSVSHNLMSGNGKVCVSEAGEESFTSENAPMGKMHQ